MITEDYVSFGVAKLLKEKGFDEKCRQYYYNDNLILSRSGICNEELHNYKEVEEGWSAPTLQMAMKWLREVHNIDVWVERHNSRYKGCIHSEQRGDEALFYEDSPEKAYEAAIKHCLENLI